jgi:S-adenosyl methyltransferase
MAIIGVESVITRQDHGYYPGGKDHFAALRETGEEAIRAYLDMRSSARANRAFLPWCRIE